MIYPSNGKSYLLEHTVVLWGSFHCQATKGSSIFQWVPEVSATLESSVLVRHRFSGKWNHHCIGTCREWRSTMSLDHWDSPENPCSASWRSENAGTYTWKYSPLAQWTERPHVHLHLQTTYLASHTLHAMNKFFILWHHDTSWRFMKYRIYRTGLTGLSRQPLEISNSRVLVFFVPIAANFWRSATLHHTDLGP